MSLAIIALFRRLSNIILRKIQNFDLLACLAMACCNFTRTWLFIIQSKKQKELGIHEYPARFGKGRSQLILFDF